MVVATGTIMVELIALSSLLVCMEMCGNHHTIYSVRVCMYVLHEAIMCTLFILQII